MNRKKEIANIDAIHAAIDLAVAIQNKGIGTAFVNLHGHCNFLAIDVHCPQWEPGRGADYSFELRVDGVEQDMDSPFRNATNEEVLNALRELLENGDTTAAEREQKAREERRQRFLELQQEFGTGQTFS